MRNRFLWSSQSKSTYRFATSKSLTPPTYMSLKLPAVLLLSLSCFSFHSLIAQDDENVSPLVESASSDEVETASAVRDTEVGTKSFDAATVNELFEELKDENERRAEQMAPHLNADSMEVIELSAREVPAYEVNNLDLLLEKLDPQPRRRLERLAELDPAAAADLQVSIRSEERFFAGEGDYINDANAGSTANVDFRKVGESVSSAIKKARAALREKKATDDQADIPTEEQ